MKIDDIALMRQKVSEFAGDKPPVSYQLAKNLTIADRELKKAGEELEKLQEQHFTKGDDGRFKTFVNVQDKEEFWFPTGEARKAYVDAKKQFDEEDRGVKWHTIPFSKVGEFIDKEKVDANHYSALLDVILIEEEGESKK
jgi:hypothetical protein